MYEEIEPVHVYHGIIWHKSITRNLLCIVRALSQKQFFFLFFSRQRNSIPCKILSRKVLPLCSTTSPFWSHFPASLLPSWQPGRATHGSPWLHFVTEVRICQTVRLHRFDSQTYLKLDARSFTKLKSSRVDATKCVIEKGRYFGYHVIEIFCLLLKARLNNCCCQGQRQEKDKRQQE